MSLKRTGRLLLVGLSALWCAALLATGTAAAKVKPGHYAPRYTAIGNSQIVGRGGDVLLVDNSDAMTLISRSGATRKLDHPGGCAGPPDAMLGGGTLLYSCQDETGAFTQRVNLPGRWRPVAHSPQGDQFCASYDTDAMARCGVVAIGARWMQIQGWCYHCATANRLQSIIDGRLIADPTNGRVIADLNAANPARRRCPDVTARPDGSVQFVGDLALITTTARVRESRYQIKRCNSTRVLHIPDTGEPTGTKLGLVATNPSLIVWPGRAGVLSGIQARTDRRFSVKLPRALTGVEQLAISSGNIYVSSGTGVAWTAPLPAALRRHKAGDRG